MKSLLLLLLALLLTLTVTLFARHSTAEDVLVDDFSDPNRYAAYWNAIGGHTDADGTMVNYHDVTKKEVILISLEEKDWTPTAPRPSIVRGSYWYSLFNQNGCYNTQEKNLKAIQFEVAANYGVTFDVLLQQKQPNCVDRDNLNRFSVKVNNYVTFTNESESHTVRIAFSEFPGLSLDRLHALVFDSFSPVAGSKIIIDNIMLVTNDTSTVPGPLPEGASDNTKEEEEGGGNNSTPGTETPNEDVLESAAATSASSSSAVPLLVLPTLFIALLSFLHLKQ